MLSNNEKITYLANLYAVARADGKLSPNELRAIEDAQKRIKATKTVLNKAETLAESSKNQTSLVRRLSMCIANLEDMVLVALADGKLDRAEAPVITGFARSAGLSNELLKRIVTETREAAAAITATRACPSCAASVPGAAKFCPECGAGLEKSDEEASIAVAYDIPTRGIAIEFAESTASGFVNGVRKAESAPVHGKCVKGKKTWYMAAWPNDQMMAVLRLVSDLKGMRNRKVWVDGKESRWDEVFGFAWCSEQRAAAYRPAEYCFGTNDQQLNIWGCRNTRLDWRSWAGWFAYGAYKKSGVLKSSHIFVFDKKRIRHELETNLFKFRHCPHIDFALIDAVLAKLPDEVKVSSDGPWRYRRDYEHIPGSIKVKEVTIDDGFKYEDTFYSSGVTPASADIGLNILKQAIELCGRSSSEVKGVLEYKGD